MYQPIWNMYASKNECSKRNSMTASNSAAVLSVRKSFKGSFILYTRKHIRLKPMRPVWAKAVNQPDPVSVLFSYPFFWTPNPMPKTGADLNSSHLACHRSVREVFPWSSYSPMPPCFLLNCSLSYTMVGIANNPISIIGIKIFLFCVALWNETNIRNRQHNRAIPLADREPPCIVVQSDASETNPKKMVHCKCPRL